MPAIWKSSHRFTVSLFTREWIEIARTDCQRRPDTASPSLRGSGLKFQPDTTVLIYGCLPLYEGVD